MNVEKLAELVGISYEVCCEMVDALEGAGFTEDQMIAIILAMSRLKKSN